MNNDTKNPEEGTFDHWVQNLPDDAPIARIKHDAELQGTAFYAWFDQEMKVQHWKANHDQMVERLRLFTQREDLPVDRLPAYQALVKAQADVARLEAICAAAYLGVALHGASQAILDVLCDPLDATDDMIDAMGKPDVEDQA